jgi:hypothetical protein
MPVEKRAGDLLRHLQEDDGETDHARHQDDQHDQADIGDAFSKACIDLA